MSRIAEPPIIPKHENVISWVNQLVIDLKLQLLGEPPNEPITPERLAEWSELRRQLERDVQRWEEIKY
jgi:hypothetical protein